MKVLLVTFASNEGDILSHFVHHYQNDVDTMLIYNDGTTDGSITKAKKIIPSLVIRDLKDVPREWKDFLAFFTRLRNRALQVARENDFDIVIIVDSDEFLSPPIGFASLRAYLEWFSQSTFAAARGIGFDIIGENEGTPEEVTLGALHSACRTMVRYTVMDKPCIFSTKRCAKVAFRHGAHNAEIDAPDIADPWASISPVLLHYKFLSLEYARSRVIRDKRTISDAIFSKHKSRALDIDSTLKSIKGF